MLRHPRLSPRSGLAGLGLVLLAAALVAGLVALFLLGVPGGSARGTRAAERGGQAGEPTPTREAEAATLVTPSNLAPAPLPAAQGEIGATLGSTPAAPESPTGLARAPGAELAPLASPTDPSASAPETPGLKSVRTGKMERVDPKDVRKKQRETREKREAEAAAAGQPVAPRATARKGAKTGEKLPAGEKWQNGKRPAKREKPAPPKDG